MGVRPSLDIRGRRDSEIWTRSAPERLQNRRFRDLPLVKPIAVVYSPLFSSSAVTLDDASLEEAAIPATATA